MAAPIVIPVQVEEQGAVRDLDKVERSIAGVGRASTTASRGATQLQTATRGLSADTKAAGRAFGANVNFVSELGLGFAALSPKARELSVHFASAGNNAVIMGGAMGPLGVVIGVVATALPVLITELVNAGDEAETTAGSMDDLTLSLDDAIGSLNELNRTQARTAAIAAGVGEAEPLAAIAQQQAERLRGQTRGLEAALESAGIAGPLAQRIAGGGDTERAQRRLRGALAQQGELGQLEALSLALERVADQRDRTSEATQAATRAQNEANEAIVQETEFRRLAEEQDEASRGGRRRRGRGGRALDSGQDLPNLDDLESQIAREKQAAAELGEVFAMELAEPQAVRLENERQIAEEMARQIQLTKELALGEQQKAALNQEHLAEQQRQTMELESQAEANRAVAGLVAQGTEAALDIFNASEGQKELFRGFSQIAQSFGAFPVVPAMVSHGIAAGLHFVNAARMGVSGGGQAPATPPSASAAGATGFGGGGEGGGGVTVINYNAAVPEALIGREQRRASRAFEARFGKG